MRFATAAIATYLASQAEALKLNASGMTQNTAEHTALETYQGHECQEYDDADGNVTMYCYTYWYQDAEGFYVSRWGDAEGGPIVAMPPDSKE